MLCVKYFISSLILWLSLGSPQDFNGASPTIDSQTEIISATNDNNRSATIVDSYLETRQAIGSFKRFKTPFIPITYQVSLPKAENYSYEFLYFEIGKTIPLKLTTSKLIFPFHCFT